MRFFCLFFLFLAFLSPLTAQQEEDHSCGYDYIQSLQQQKNPDYLRELEQYRQEVVPQLIQAAEGRTLPAVITIPVVIHVIHGGEIVGQGRNLAVSRIMSQLDILNEDYRRLNSDANETPSAYQGVAADAEIEFCLVQNDPEGNPSDGITRHQYSNISSISYIEDVIKPATRWNANYYLNIWTIDIPGSTIVGYSYLPTSSMVGSNQDGVVLNFNNVGAVNTSSTGRTATHEVGHYLGLQHVWGANDNNGNPIGCDSDDGISDTPNADGPYYGCPSSGSSCSSNDMYMNYMDYVNDDCMNLFSEGQADVMRGVLNGSRSNLVGNANTACSFSCFNLANSDLNMGFETGQSLNGWLVENTNSDSRTWLLTQTSTSDWGPSVGTGLAVYLWNNNGTTAADDYLFTPCFQIEEGNVYELEFVYACAEDNNGLYPEKLEIGFSDNQTSQDFYTIGDDWIFNDIENAYPNFAEANLQFLSTSNGSISIGFHAISEADRYALQIDNIRLKDLGPATPTEEINITEELSVYPNPNKGTFQVAMTFAQAQENVSLQVYDILGRTIQQREIDNTNEVNWAVELGTAEAGMYFVKIQSGSAQWIEKVVIE